MFGEVLVYKIISVQPGCYFQPFGSKWIAAKIKCARVDHLLRERQRSIELGDHPGLLGGQVGMKFHQVVQRNRRRPAGKTVVANVNDATDAQLSPDEIDDHPIVLVRYPRPDAV